MSIAASPPTSDSDAIDYDQVREELNADIASVRAEIRKLSERRKLLSSALLASTAIQTTLQTVSQNPDPNFSSDAQQLLADARRHNQTQVARLTYGVTAFPFHDPSPDTSNLPLLGIRFDISNRHGKFETPFYIICKRADDASTNLRIHHHTIPAFVPIHDYEREYLPLPDEGYGSEDGSPVDSRQDLHEIARKVRHDLVSWVLRRDAIDLLNEKLELPKRPEQRPIGYRPGPGEEEMEDAPESEGKFDVYSIEPTGFEARQARIVWSDGRVGRIEIADSGMIRRVRVIGDDGRDRVAEQTLMANGTSNIQNFWIQLEKLHKKDTKKN